MDQLINSDLVQLKGFRAPNCVRDCDVSAVREPPRHCAGIDIALLLSERARPCRAAPRMPRRPCYSHHSAGARTHPLPLPLSNPRASDASGWLAAMSFSAPLLSEAPEWKLSALDDAD